MASAEVWAKTKLFNLGAPIRPECSGFAYSKNRPKMNRIRPDLSPRPELCPNGLPDKAGLNLLSRISLDMFTYAASNSNILPIWRKWIEIP